MFRNEYNYFLTALQFLTRIQVPAHYRFQPSYLQASVRYLPLVGQIVAALGVLAYLICSKWLGTELAILAYMLATIYITGAFHEDGWADTCDAFGGGYDKEQVLRIMKDSRLGTYGTIGLIGILATKFLLLRELPGYAPAGLRPSLNPLLNYKTFVLLALAAHGCSRWMGTVVMQRLDYVSGEGKSKPMATEKPGAMPLLLGGAFAVWPLLFLPPWFLLVLPPMLLAAWQMSNWFRARIGGYSGDCLGAVQQLTEIVFYLAALILWRYIV